MKIDYYADIACPWCYIGLRRMARALQNSPSIKVVHTWHPFQLQPQLPAEGVPWTEFADQKFGGMARAKKMFDHVAEQGKEAGIQFAFDKIVKANNTRDAHRLILLAQEQQLGWKMAEALFSAYFVEGKDLNDRGDLMAAAASAGIENEPANAFLDSGRFAEEVNASQRRSGELGISGVPFYVINDKFGISGAQPTQVLVDAFAKIAAE